jgi:hypothetical protein
MSQDSTSELGEELDEGEEMSQGSTSELGEELDEGEEMSQGSTSVEPQIHKKQHRL